MEVFCTWLEDQSRSWVISSTAAHGRLVDIQPGQRAQVKSRTQFSFDAVIELTDEDNDWVRAEKQVFSDFRLRRGIYRANVITIMVMPGPRAGRVVIRALCNDNYALGAFSEVLTRIGEYYPEVLIEMQEAQDGQFIGNQLARVTNIPAMKRGRKGDPDYDKAYQNIINGMGRDEAFRAYLGQTNKQKSMTAHKRNFERAMRDGSKKDSSNDDYD